MNVTKNHIKISTEWRPDGSEVLCQSNIKLMTQHLQKIYVRNKQIVCQNIYNKTSIPQTHITKVVWVELLRNKEWLRVH